MRTRQQGARRRTRAVGSDSQARSRAAGRLLRLPIAVIALHACGHQNARPELGARLADRATASSATGFQPIPLVLTSSELAVAGPGLSLHETLQRLHPQVLHWRDRRRLTSDAVGNMDGALPVVFVDGARVGDVSLLRTVPALRVRKVVLLSPRHAVQRFGRGHEAGAILITSSTSVP